MGDTPYIFPEAQAAYLRALQAGRCAGETRSRGEPVRVSLVDRLPPVYQQALQGTCVANAVTALLEYYGDCRTRLSVQYLASVTRDVERKGLERNLEALRTGGPLDAGFEAVFHAELLQLRLLADANGGMDVPAVRPYLTRFAEGVKTRFSQAPGSLLMSCFRAVETRGVCRYSLWPSATLRTTSVFGELDAAPVVPPGADEDAAKRRVTSGLYLLGMPNNVDEIRGLLAGANGRRAMPVAVTVDFFTDCDGATYAFPGTEERADGRLASKNAWRGRHALLVVGYEDDARAPGGGWFLIRNSFGEAWGDKGYGRLSYAYLACFAIEAGTILQDLVDYAGDGYDRLRPGGATQPSAPSAVSAWPFGRRLALNLGIACALVGLTLAVVWMVRRGPVPGVVPPPPPFGGEEVGGTVRYKVFFDCESADERQKLRQAFASENVGFPVEFMQQNLTSVLALRVTVGSQDDVVAALGEVLRRNYEGPSKELWADMEVLLRLRRVYVVKDALRRWNGGQ